MIQNMSIERITGALVGRSFVAAKKATMSSVMRAALILLMGVTLAACGKQQGKGANPNGTLGAQSTPTYTLAEYDADFNGFELMIDSLYEYGIEPIFDDGLIIDFISYGADPSLQVPKLNEVAQSSENLLKKYGKKYYVQTGEVTYLAELNPIRVEELKTTKSAALALASAILSGAYKPQHGKASPSKVKLSDRQIEDWEKRANGAGIKSRRRGPKPKDPKEDDPSTGKAPKKKALAAATVLNNSDGDPPKKPGDDPATGVKPKSKIQFHLVAAKLPGNGTDGVDCKPLDCEDPATGIK